MENKALRWQRAFAFLMQHLRSQEEENHTKTEFSSFWEGFPFLLNYAFLLINTASGNGKVSSIRLGTRSARAPRRNIECWENKRTRKWQWVGKFQGLMMPDNSDNFLRRLAWQTRGEQFSLAWLQMALDTTAWRTHIAQSFCCGSDSCMENWQDSSPRELRSTAQSPVGSHLLLAFLRGL